VTLEGAGSLGDEATADTNRVFAELFGPNASEIHANGWKDRDVKNGEEGVRNAFHAGEIECHAAEAEVYDAGTMGRLVAKNGVGVCSGH